MTYTLNTLSSFQNLRWKKGRQIWPPPRAANGPATPLLASTPSWETKRILSQIAFNKKGYIRTFNTNNEEEKKHNTMRSNEEQNIPKQTSISEHILIQNSV